MLNNWEKDYSRLVDFINKHPDVVLIDGKTRIPNNIRSEFYVFFNATRQSFIEENLPVLHHKAKTLSENYLEAEDALKQKLNLHDISMLIRLNRFLHDPMYQLIRAMFDPLMGLIKNSIDIRTFKHVSSTNVMSSFVPLYRWGYEKWVVISLVNILCPNNLFQVKAREFMSDEERVTMQTGQTIEEAMPPKEANSISFGYEREVTFTVPDLIINSARLKKHISFKSQIGDAFASATSTIGDQEWLSIDSVEALDPDFTLLYKSDNPKSLSLIGQSKKICRPDLLIECRSDKDWFEKDGLDKVKLHHNSLMPRLGTYIICNEPVHKNAYNELSVKQTPDERLHQEKTDSESVAETPKDNIHILEVGFDESKLEPIIDAIK